MTQQSSEILQKAEPLSLHCVGSQRASNAQHQTIVIRAHLETDRQQQPVAIVTNQKERMMRSVVLPSIHSFIHPTNQKMGLRLSLRCNFKRFTFFNIDRQFPVRNDE